MIIKKGNLPTEADATLALNYCPFMQGTTGAQINSNLWCARIMREGSGVGLLNATAGTYYIMVKNPNTEPFDSLKLWYMPDCDYQR